jgi:hypothetical protein
MIIRTPVKPAAPASPPPGDDTLNQHKPAAPQVVASAPPPAAAGTAEHAPLPAAAIQVLSGAAAGRTLDLTKNLTTVGKPGLQVAVITKRPNGYFITHVEGATFPTLNGVALGSQAHPLSDHDMIEIAGVKMEFFFKT